MNRSIILPEHGGKDLPAPVVDIDHLLVDRCDRAFLCRLIKKSMLPRMTYGSPSQQQTGQG